MIVTLDNCLVPECVSSGSTSHKWEFERPTVQELLKIQEVLGLDPDEFEAALNEKMSARMIKAAIMLVVIFHKRDGVLIPPSQDGFYEGCDFDIAELDFLTDPAPEPEGKEQTSSPLPEEHARTSSTSGLSPGVVSEPSSSTMGPTSGGGTGSP